MEQWFNHAVRIEENMWKTLNQPKGEYRQVIVSSVLIEFEGIGQTDSQVFSAFWGWNR